MKKRDIPIKNKSRFLIKACGKLYWSNEYGWVNEHAGTIYSFYDKQTLNLPIDGKWVKIKGY